MKKSVLSLLLLLCLLLTGCGNSGGAPEKEAESEPVTEKNTENNDNQESSPEPVNQITPEFGGVGGYFSVTLPQSWMEKVSYDCYLGKEDGCYNVAFSQRAGQSVGHGGKLMTLMVLPEDYDYTVFPSYEFLGSLKVEGTGNFILVVLYPTDVQFSEGDEEEYRALFEETGAVIDSITLSSGVEYLN